MPSDEVTSLLTGGGAPALKFPTVGTSYTGVVVSSVVQVQRDMETNEIKTFPDGNPIRQIVITLQTELRDSAIENDDGQRRIFVKGAMFKELRRAITEAGAPTLEEGATLTVTYSDNGEAKKRGFTPPKLYEIEYVRPTQETLDQVAQVAAAFGAEETGGYGFDEEPF